MEDWPDFNSPYIGPVGLMALQMLVISIPINYIVKVLVIAVCVILALIKLIGIAKDSENKRKPILFAIMEAVWGGFCIWGVIAIGNLPF